VAEQDTANPDQRHYSSDRALFVPGHKIDALMPKDLFENSTPIVEMEVSPACSVPHDRIPFGGRPLKRLNLDPHALALWSARWAEAAI